MRHRVAIVIIVRVPPRSKTHTRCHWSGATVGMMRAHFEQLLQHAVYACSSPSHTRVKARPIVQCTAAYDAANRVVKLKRAVTHMSRRQTVVPAATQQQATISKHFGENIEQRFVNLKIWSC